MIIECACNYFGIRGIVVFYNKDNRRARDVDTTSSWMILEGKDRIHNIIVIGIKDESPIKIIRTRTYKSSKLYKYIGRRMLFILTSDNRPLVWLQRNRTRKEVTSYYKVRMINKYKYGINPFEGIENMDLDIYDMIFDCKIERVRYILMKDIGRWIEVTAKIENFATDRKYRERQYRKQIIYNRPLHKRAYILNIFSGKEKIEESQREQ